MPVPVSLVIFDMDGVLATLDRPRRNRWLSEATGKPPSHFDATIWHSDFESSAEAGAYSDPADYLAEFNRRSGCSLSGEAWIEARRQAMTPLPGILALARELQQVVEVALLTNNGSLLKEGLPELFPEAWAIFGDRAHVSCEFQARKPEARVFHRLLDRYGVVPGQALLIDDDPVNVAGAHAAGLEAILFEDPGSLRQDLRNLGVLPSS
jgi:putative hydrolase of the HAD superfamily